MHTYTLLVSGFYISRTGQASKKVHGIYGCNLLKALPETLPANMDHLSLRSS